MGQCTHSDISELSVLGHSQFPVNKGCHSVIRTNEEDVSFLVTMRDIGWSLYRKLIAAHDEVLNVEKGHIGRTPDGGVSNCAVFDLKQTMVDGGHVGVTTGAVGTGVFQFHPRAESKEWPY